MSECTSAHKARLTLTAVSGTILCDEHDEHVLISAHEARLGPMAQGAFFARGNPVTTAEKLSSLPVRIQMCIFSYSHVFAIFICIRPTHAFKNDKKRQV